ncbi:MAG: PKD domain-containing protein, partial [Verrucomicrobiota bacterium]
MAESGSASASLERGVELAKARMETMRELIKTNPARALEESLSLSEWINLPPEIKPYVEEPVSSFADVDVFISCGMSASHIDRVTTLADGRRFDAYTSGNRLLAKTRKNIPVQGIMLDDVGALENTLFQPLDDADESSALTRYPVANPDQDRCFATGGKLGNESVAALAGGRIYYFKDGATLAGVEERLSSLDTLAGPYAASHAIYSALFAAPTEEGFDLESATQTAMELSEAWSGTPRDMYVILVDFSDIPGQPVDPALLENVINTTVSQQISDMSYQQTYIDCIVDTNTYRMPEPSGVYASNHIPMHDHAVAAVVADGIDLSPYETICVYFGHIPGLMTMAGYGSIGGEKMWIHNTTSPRVITHELGHNYGSYHAHSWDVLGSDPVDPAGTHEEYGDFSDIMGGAHPPAGHFHVQNKLEVQWLTPENIVVPTNSGTYRVYRSDHPLTDPASARGIQIDKGATNYYWVGYRQLYPEHEHYGRGTYLLWQQPNAENYPKSHLLDMTPGSDGGKQDGGLALGRTYSDPLAQVHITPVRRGGNTPNEWMDVTLNLGDFPGNGIPSASIVGPTNGMARESIAFAVDATDPDGDELAYSWDFGDGLVKDNASQSSGIWMIPGTGTVECTISDMKGGKVIVQQDIVLSDPLESWPHQNTITIAFLYGITSDGERLVTVGSNGFTGTSTNGINWTSGNVGGSFANVTLYGIIHDGTQFIAVGRDWISSAWAGVVYTSPDGSTWTKRHEIATLSLNDVATGNGVKIAVGYSGTLLRSTNGQNWSSIGMASTNHLMGVSYGQGLFTTAGRTATGDPVVFVSPDGITWHNRSSGAGTGLLDFDTLQFCNDMFLASGSYVGIRRSDNYGTSFSVSTDDYYHIPAFAYGNGIYFAAGIDQNNADTDINLISSDGINWTALPTAAQQDRNAATFFKNCFVTVGKSGSIWKSDPLGTAESGWALWQYFNLSALGPNRGAEDDPDGDGVLNLVEYALGTDATDASSLPTFRSDIDGSGYFKIEI